MMKAHLKILIFIYLILTIRPCHSQLQSINELGNFRYTYKHNKFYWGLPFNLNGNIKSIDQKKYRLISKSGKLERGRVIQSDDDSNISLKFDEYGNVVENSHYNYPIKIETTHIENSYDDKGNIIESKTYAQDGKLLETRKYKYDENYNLTEVMGTNAENQLINSIIYKYDEIGRITEKEWIVDSNTYKKYSYSYDENDNPIEIVYTNLNYNDLFDVIFQTAFEASLYLALNLDPPNPSDPLDPAYSSGSDKPKDFYLRIERNYDEQKNLIEETIYDIEYQKYPGQLIEKYNCEYDNNENIVKELRTRGDTSVELHHKYDANGYKIETNLHYIQFSDFKTEIKSIIMNDDEGKAIEIIEYIKTKYSAIKFSESFEYDSNNNVSKIYFFKKDKPKYVIERKIEYY